MDEKKKLLMDSTNQPSTSGMKSTSYKSTKCDEDIDLVPDNSCAMSEVIILTTACILMVTLTIGLFLNMSDDWTADPEIRTRVFVLALILFCLNILFCCYMTRRLGVQICRPQYDIESNYNHSVNNPLLMNDLPPSYDAVVINNTVMINPPTYEELGANAKPFDSAQVHHKATG